LNIDFVPFGISFLLRDPLFKPPYGLTFYRQLNVGISRMYVLPAGMTHQSLADVLHNTGFHKAGIEGVTRIMEAEPPNAGAPKRPFPGGLDDVDWLIMKREDQPVPLCLAFQQLLDACGQWDLSRLTFRCF
jgi:hypothetical protein